MKAKNYPRICDNCKWFDKWEEDDTDLALSLSNGICRRYPYPKAKRSKEWCGEFAIMRDPRVCEEATDE